MNAKRHVVACLPLLLVSEAAMAHSPIQGIGNFYNGVLHPLMVPAHLLLLVAAGLFWGQQGHKAVKTALAVFAVATVVGLTAAWFSVAIQSEVLILVLSAFIGLLVAIAPKVGLFWCGVIALLAGFFLGIDSAQEELYGEDKFVTLFGSGIAIYFLVLYPVAVADYLNKKPWQKIGVRVIGSWVAASALLVLALSLSPQAQA